MAIANIEHDIIVIALNDVSLGAVGKYAVSGVVECNVKDSGVTAGDALVPVASTEALDELASITNTKIVGYALEAYSASALSKVWFDGLNGVGHNET
jgi:hypothetical protein